MILVGLKGQNIFVVRYAYSKSLTVLVWAMTQIRSIL